MFNLANIGKRPCPHQPMPYAAVRGVVTDPKTIYSCDGTMIVCAVLAGDRNVVRGHSFRRNAGFKAVCFEA